MAAVELKVLVIDDEPAVRNALHVLLEVHGIPHVTASSPDEAIEIVRSGPIGVVLQDMNYGPEKTSGEQGIRLFHRIREVDAEIPVLLMTAWASLETAVSLIKLGANDYLAKPWEDEKLIASLTNLLRLRRLQLENDQLRRLRHEARDALTERFDLCGVVYESDEMHRLIALATQVAGSDAPVLVTGPSGAGKEKLAEIVQANSRRRDKPFLRVNVGAMPGELMEAELFGAEAGAYTGATARRIGHFETAHRGTLFLDEIDALPLAGQVKLLRVVQSGEFQRLGSSEPRQADVRIVSSTNADLKEAVAAGTFREDLYYRLNVIELRVPPLRNRPEDILPLARHFLATGEGDGDRAEMDAEAEAALLCHEWPGNVRELENRIQRARLTAAGKIITRADLDLDAPPATVADNDKENDLRAGTATDPQRIKIERALVEADGVVARAAEQLGMSRQALYRKMEKLGIVLERRPR